MCGRLGSMLTVCDSPMWLVSPISAGSEGFVTSTVSRPHCGAASRPPTPLIVAAALGVGGVDDDLRLGL